MTELTLLSRVAFRGRQINGARLIGLLALLASELRTGCGINRLVEGLWPDKQAEHPTNAVQVLVSRARSQLGPDIIVNTATGYRLTLPDTEVDAAAVLLSASAGSRQSRAGDHAAALAHAEAGLVFWDETPSAEPGGDPLSALRAERALTYQSLVRVRALSLARLGRHAEAVPVLTTLFAECPRDEELLLELLRCENATMGPSAAVSRYEEYRRSLRDELGTDPGQALQALHRQLLQGESPVVRYGVLHDPNPLLGRQGDITAVTALLRTSRVVSIVGPGGLGKTRLAHAVSRQAEQRVVYFVSLAGLTEDVAAEVASVLEADNVVKALDGSGALLVLDNCEHVLDEVIELVGAVVSQTEDVRVLTTSRAPLGLSSEAAYLLPELDSRTAVELFTQRACAARPDVSLPGPVVEELCRKLDGLPLALELAAARVRVMSVEEIARRLSDRFALLRGGVRDAPRRHHTLEAVVEWSWQLLDLAGRAALPVLSVFPGDFTAAAVRSLLGSDEVIEQLVDQSLLKVREARAGTRFRMLETVREFGALRRDPAVTETFLAWARDFGLAHFEAPFGADPFAATEVIRPEQDNLIHAMRLGITRGDAPTVAATGAALVALWMIESNYQRVTALTAETTWILSHYQPEPELVDAVRTISVVSSVSSFAIKGTGALRSLYNLHRLPVGDPGDSVVRAGTKVLATAAKYWTTDHSVLRALCDDPNPLVAGCANLLASYSDSDPDRALAEAQRAAEYFTVVDRPWMRVTALSLASSLCYHAGLYVRARDYMRVTLPLFERMGSSSDVTQIRWAMVSVCMHLGEIDEAERWLALAAANRADDIFQDLLPGPGVRAELLLARGEIDAGLRQWRRAVDQLRTPRGQAFVATTPGLQAWTLEFDAVAVVAHAQHGKLDLVADIVATLPDKLATLLDTPLAGSSPFIVDLPMVGALLVAMAAVDTRHAPRMVALAERCRYLRGYQPTMTPERIRGMAELQDKAAYDEAVAEYAALPDDDLRAAASTLLKARLADQVTDRAEHLVGRVDGDHAV